MHSLLPRVCRGAIALVITVSVVRFALPAPGADAATTSISISSPIVSPATITPPGSAALSATITVPTAMPSSIVDFEVFNASNTRVFQTYQTGVNLLANVPQAFNAVWAVPASQAVGTYRLRVGIFNQWWSYRFAWTDTGTAFQLAAVSPAQVVTSPSATATTVPAPLSIASPVVNPATIAPPGNVSLSAGVSTGTALPSSIVDFEVFDAGNTRVFQTFQTGVNILANTPQTFSATWAVPASQAAGTYRLRVGIFNQWWSYRFAWTDTGTTFQVTAARPTSTPAASPTNTPVPLSISNPSVSPSTVAPPGSVTLSAGLTTGTAMPNTIVDFEVFDASNTRVFQTYQSGVNLLANSPQTFSAKWAVPLAQAAGTYQLRVGVFNQSWSYRYAWTNVGPSFQITVPLPTSTATPSPTSTPGPPPGPLTLGVWIPGDLWDPTVVDSYTTMVGTAPKIVMWYQDWQNDSGFHTAAMNSYLSRGAMPMISWLPDGTLASPTFDRAVANGSYDAFLHQWAHDAAAWGHPFYMRLAWEMNGNWQPFSPGVNGNTSADFVAMWRHIHDLFVQDGATNVRWVWSPNSEYTGSTPYADVYPGDAYVDWIGVSGYNFGHYDQWHWWTSLHDVLAPSYSDLTALSAKPMIITETASTEVGGDKAAWITQAFLTDIPTYFPRVRAVVWFDENKENDWRVNSSPASLAAFQKVAASPQYQGTLP